MSLGLGRLPRPEQATAWDRQMGAVEDLSVRDEQGALRRHRLVIVCAAGGVLLLYALAAYFGARLLRRYAAETARVRQARIVSLPTDPTSHPPAAAPTPSSGAASTPVDVKVALNVNRIGLVALRDSSWTVDFNISFRWKGDAVAPGKNFRVTSGQIDQREKVDAYERGGERYEQYRVVARISKFFDASRFPFGDEGLAVKIEDATQGVEALRYVADDSNCGVEPEAMPRHLRLATTMFGVTVQRQGAARDAHSQFFVALLIASDSAPIYVNMFQALFAAVAVTFIVFFIKATLVAPRFGLPVGAFFAAVSNNTFVSGVLPAADRVTLASMVNATGLATIFLVLVESAVSLYVLDTLGQERLSRFCDRTFVVVLVLGYLAVNLALPLAARG